MAVHIQSTPFDPGKLHSEFLTLPATTGAVVTFTGCVRDTEGDLRHLEIEHYPGMTQKAIEAIEKTAMTRWKLDAVLIVHRHGRLKVGEPIMMVATASPHRVAAFEAAEYLMDYLKSRAPFWKKEVVASGEAWVGAEESDETALDRWS